MNVKLAVAAVVAFYMAAALVMVFVNKAVLNNAPDLPLTFLLVQLLIAVVLLHFSALFTPRVVIPKIERETAVKLTPVVLVNIIGLVFNTLCLRGVEASFFQIARGLVLPLTIVVSSIHTHTNPSQRVIFAALVVTIGFFIGVTPSSTIPLAATPSFISLTYGVFSSLFIAFHAVLIKSSLPHCNNSSIELAYWTNLGSAIFLAPFVFLNGEPANLRAHFSDPKWNAETFVYGCLVTGFFGFLLCVASVLSVKVTSPVTHMFSSAARSVLQTLLGVWLFGDILTVNRALSIAVIATGTMLYTWIKSMESANAAPQSKPADIESHGKNQPEDARDIVFEVPEKDITGTRK